MCSYDCSRYDAALNVRRWGNCALMCRNCALEALLLRLAVAAVAVVVAVIIPQSDVDQVVRPQEGLQRISGPPLVKKKPLCFSSTIASLSSSL